MIEAIPVGRDRWRAQLVRRGMTNAIMPFYGTTPDDAADHLATWLTRAGKAIQSPLDNHKGLVAK